MLLKDLIHAKYLVMLASDFNRVWLLSRKKKIPFILLNWRLCLLENDLTARLAQLVKVKSMQRSGTEAIRTQIQPSKPKREITKITNSQNTKRT